MALKRKQSKEKITEQNEFLHSILRSLEDIKKGRVKKFEGIKCN